MDMRPMTPLTELRRIVAAGPPFPDGFVSALEDDPRAGARVLGAACRKTLGQTVAEKGRLEKLMQFEREAAESGFHCVAGVDEAGRGPLAGPIVAAAVILRHPIEGLNDSKQLTHDQREELYERLRASSNPIGTGILDADDIDRRGIQSANYGVMAQAVAQLVPQPDFLLVDGFLIKGCALPQKPLIKGDSRSASIAAASIIAKVTRDRIMKKMDTLYPGYGFALHKGYGTREHCDALQKLGPCPIHRRSFAPVTASLTTESLFADENQ